jgi:hypothetical protein
MVLNRVATGWWLVTHIGLEHLAMPTTVAGSSIFFFSTTS